jgi:hypothetical protein
MSSASGEACGNMSERNRGFVGGSDSSMLAAVCVCVCKRERERERARERERERESERESVGD